LANTIGTTTANMRTFATAKTKHIIRTWLWRTSHEPLRLELAGIRVYSRIVADIPAQSAQSVNVDAFRRIMASPNVDEHHGTFGDEISLIRIVFHGGVRYSYKDIVSRLEH